MDYVMDVRIDEVQVQCQSLSLREELALAGALSNSAHTLASCPCVNQTWRSMFRDAQKCASTRHAMGRSACCSVSRRLLRSQDAMRRLATRTIAAARHAAHGIYEMICISGVPILKPSGELPNALQRHESMFGSSLVNFIKVGLILTHGWQAHCLPLCVRNHV
jgi:hypothetical protein